MEVRTLHANCGQIQAQFPHLITASLTYKTFFFYSSYR
jgi:hypothetical protein